MDAGAMVNAIVVCAKAFRGVVDSNMSVELVLGVNTHGAGEVGKKADDGDSGGCPIGLQFLNVMVRIHAVGENGSCDGVCCSTDFLCQSVMRTDRVGHV